MIIYGIDHDIRQWRKNQLPRAALGTDAACIGKGLEQFCCVIEPLNCGAGKGGVVKPEEIGDAFQIVRGGPRPPQPSQARIIRATRASISSSSRNSPRAI